MESNPSGFLRRGARRCARGAPACPRRCRRRTRVSARLASRSSLGQRRGAARARVAAVQETLFSVPIRDLERSDQRRTWEVPPAWIDRALAESEARSDGTPGALEVYLKKTGREILVKGQVRAGVQMPCARTLEPVAVALDAEILLLLTPRATPAATGAGAARPGRRQRRPKAESGAAFQADAGDVDDSSSEVLSAEEAARDLDGGGGGGLERHR